MEGICQHWNESSGFRKVEEYLDNLRYCYVLKKELVNIEVRNKGIICAKPSEFFLAHPLGHEATYGFGLSYEQVLMVHAAMTSIDCRVRARVEPTMQPADGMQLDFSVANCTECPVPILQLDTQTLYVQRRSGDHWDSRRSVIRRETG
jgi:hypothetical protein